MVWNVWYGMYGMECMVCNVLYVMYGMECMVWNVYILGPLALLSHPPLHPKPSRPPFPPSSTS